MLKLIHKQSKNGKYYTAIITTDAKTDYCFEPVAIRLALTLTGEGATDLARELNLPYVARLLKAEQPWELDIK